MIYVIITTCINNKFGIVNYEDRKYRYIDCISESLRFFKNNSNIKCIIVENSGITSSYLDELHSDVIYTNNNVLKFNHKGVNELLDIKEVINKYNIDDNDTVIKLTGRYKLLNNSFLNLVENNIETYDAFLKFYHVCLQKYDPNDCILGLIAIKCKYLKQFEYKCILSPEMEFAEFVRANVEKFKEVDTLGLECCFADCYLILNV
jgi:hypothetical protein